MSCLKSIAQETIKYKSYNKKYKTKKQTKTLI